MFLKNTFKLIFIVSTLLIPMTAYGKTPIVDAFVTLSQKPNYDMQEFEAGLNNYKSFEQMITDGIIETPYNCLPEFRIECFKILNSLKPSKDGYIVQEWGEWQDVNRDEKSLKEFVNGQFREANKLGFNLFKSDEVKTNKGKVHYTGYDETLGAFDEVTNLKIISVIEALEDNCRGSFTDLTWSWCGVRHLAYDFINNRRNICNGTNDQATFEYRWHKCTKNSNR